MWGKGTEPTVVCVEFRVKYCHLLLRTVVLPVVFSHCSFVLERVGPEGLSEGPFHSQDESSAAFCLWCSWPETFLNASSSHFWFSSADRPVPTSSAYSAQISVLRANQSCLLPVTLYCVLFITAAFVTLYCPHTALQLSEQRWKHFLQSLCSFRQFMSITWIKNRL